MRRLSGIIKNWLSRLWRYLLDSIRHSLSLGLRLFDVFRRASGQAETVKPSPAPAPDILGSDGDPALLNAIDSLAKRAVVDIFDWLGLSHVPAQFWPILERMRLPGESVTHFVEAIGCDAARVRARDAEEIERVQVIVDLLAQCNDLFAGMTDEQRGTLRDRVFVGSFDAVRQATAALADLNFVLETGRRRAARTHFAAYAQFLSEVEHYAKDPFSMSSADAEGAKAVSQDYLAWMDQFDLLTARFEDRMASLANWWPDDWLGTPMEAEFSDAESQFEDAQRGLLNESGLSGDDILILLHALEEQADLIDSLFDRAQSHMSAGTAGSGSTGSAGAGSGTFGGLGAEVEDALAFFKFPSGLQPAWDQIKKTYRKLMMDIHPDREKDEAEKKRKEELCKAATHHYSVLRNAFAA